MSRHATEEILVDLGHVVSAVDRGEDTALALGSACDLFITDHQVPAVDGLALARKIRGSPGALRNLPIVMIAGCEDPLISTVAYRAGVTVFFPKPRPGKNLRALLDQLCLCVRLSKLSGQPIPALPLVAGSSLVLH